MWSMLLNNLLYNIQTVQVLGFFLALVISYLLTPLIQVRALKLGILDKPSKRKIHDKPVPRLGGVSIYVSLFFTSLILLSAYLKYRTSLAGTFTLLGIFSGGTIIFFLGLLDDIEPIPPQLKLVFQIIAASVAWFLGVKILQIVNPFYHADFFLVKVSFGDQLISFNTILSYLLTIIWIVGITNAINLVDGMDGLATGVCLISAVAIWAVSVDYRINQPGGALMASTIAGALLGFLRWNFNPARIFLGDSGAYLTGFVLACLTVSCVVKKVTLAIMTPVLILIFALPIIDTLLAVVRRTLSRRSILEPDKEHLHHKMLAFGFSQKVASFVLYLISAFLGLLATYLVSLKSSLRFLIISVIVLWLVLFYTFIINWKHQKLFRDMFGKSQ